MSISTNLALQYQKLTYIIIILVVLLLITALLFFDRNFKKMNQSLMDHNSEIVLTKVSHLKELIVYLSKKNHLLLDIKYNITQLKKDASNTSYHRALNQVKTNINHDNDWHLFNVYFNDIYPRFYSKINTSYPNITQHELHLMALLKLELSNNQAIQILNISHEGIKKARYRLRKKMNLETSQSLEETIFSI